MRLACGLLSLAVGVSSLTRGISVRSSMRSLAAGSRHGAVASLARAVPDTLPDLCVFDLDACLWDKEMFEMPSIPAEADARSGDLNGRGEGVVGVMSGPHMIRLHAGALEALQLHADGAFGGMRVALASSADTPLAEQIGRKALTLLEVIPGLTIWQLLMRDWDGVDVNQIGRQPPLSSNKAASHFPRLREATGVRYDGMLFYDDCNWGDHVGKVCGACKEEDSGRGVVGVRTPRGLGSAEFWRGLEAYAKAD